MLQSKGMLFAGALLLATAWWEAAPAFELNIHSIVADPARFDHQKVVLLGRIANVRARSRRAADGYTTFTLDDAGGNGVTIFMWGHPDLTDGEHVRVTGEFRSERRVGRHALHDEIEASSVVPWR